MGVYSIYSNENKRYEIVFVAAWLNSTQAPLTSRGRGDSLYVGTGCAIFGGALLQEENKFLGYLFLLKSQVVINFGVSLLQNRSLGY